MPNNFFQFKQFRIEQDQCGMKVTTDACFMGAIVPIWNGAKVLDIGTGTGLLSLMSAQRANIQIDAIEIDKQAFQQAKSNFKASPWQARLNAIHSALQSFEASQRYDLILCNPPFFKASQKGNRTNKNKALHAIHLSMEDLASYVKPLLEEKGEFWVMYPEQEMIEFIAIAAEQGLQPYSHVKLRNAKEASVFRDIISFSAEEPVSKMFTDVTIRDADGKYTEEFRAWLKDYYLHL